MLVHKWEGLKWRPTHTQKFDSWVCSEKEDEARSGEKNTTGETGKRQRNCHNDCQLVEQKYAIAVAEVRALLFRRCFPEFLCSFREKFGVKTYAPNAPTAKD
ncbi:uncharacterized protein LOC121601594 [Anopheles merus]|uniref:uncharacterized protein LOC121601594 n=1 Tax=Anopheles merus TaxID=30066 RepID=UPI001BE42105|nr:uncharacterized protein LOC121601594 [Anopheles merus]